MGYQSRWQTGPCLPFYPRLSAIAVVAFMATGMIQPTETDGSKFTLRFRGGHFSRHNLAYQACLQYWLICEDGGL